MYNDGVSAKKTEIATKEKEKTMKTTNKLLSLVLALVMVLGTVTEVHVRIASAPLKYTCYYGVDVHTPQELISNSNDVDQVCRLIDADSLAFLSHEGMYAAGGRNDLCLACFNHKYPTDLYEE